MSDTPDIVVRNLRHITLQLEDERQRREETEDRLKETEEELHLTRAALADLRLHQQVYGSLLAAQTDLDRRLKVLESAHRLRQSKDMLRR